MLVFVNILQELGVRGNFTFRITRPVPITRNSTVVNRPGSDFSVTEYFAKSLKVIQGHTKRHP